MGIFTIAVTDKDGSTRYGGTFENEKLARAEADAIPGAEVVEIVDTPPVPVLDTWTVSLRLRVNAVDAPAALQLAQDAVGSIDLSHADVSSASLAVEGLAEEAVDAAEMIANG